MGVICPIPELSLLGHCRLRFTSSLFLDFSWKKTKAACTTLTKLVAAPYPIALPCLLLGELGRGGDEDVWLRRANSCLQYRQAADTSWCQRWPPSTSFPSLVGSVTGMASTEDNLPVFTKAQRGSRYHHHAAPLETHPTPLNPRMWGDLWTGYSLWRHPS